MATGLGVFLRWLKTLLTTKTSYLGYLEDIQLLAGTAEAVEVGAGAITKLKTLE